MLESIFPVEKCKRYIDERGGKAELITAQDFDNYFRLHMFREGPYNSKEQSYGVLKTGEIVYCQKEPKSL